MPWIDQAVNWLSPERGLRRAAARARIERLAQIQKAKRNRLDSYERTFEAIAGGRGRSDFLTTTDSADKVISGGAQGLRHHVRQLEYNNGFISGPIKRIVANVVGTGFRFQARVKGEEAGANDLFSIITQEAADRFNSAMEKAFNLWASKYADVRMIMSLPEILSLLEASLVRDGEVLAIGRRSKRPGRPIPFCVEVLEIDRLQTPYEEINNPSIRNGIEYDDEGAPKNYYILKRHPGDFLAVMNLKGGDFDSIPAFNEDGTRKVFHLFNPWRPEQSRGFSDFASGLKDLQDFDRFMEAEKFAMLEDACLTGFVTTPAPTVFQPGYTTESDADGNRIHEFAPNKWHYLKPGEDIEIHSPKRPNNSLEEIFNQLLRGPSSAIDIPPEVLTQNWGDLNYSNARTILMQFYLKIKIRQLHLINHFCIPVYENVAPELVAVGAVKAPGFDRRKEDYLVCKFIPPGTQWVDPVKEVDSKCTEVDNLFETLSEVCAMKGNDFEETAETRARELKKIKELEEKFGIKFKAAPKPANQTAGKSGKEDTDAETDTDAATDAK